MVEKIFNIYNSIDDKIKKIIKDGLIFCFILAIIAGLFMLTYNFYSSITIYYIGFYLIKNSILFACIFFSFGIGFDKIIKDIT